MVLVSIGIVIATFIFMEWVAWATHKYVMHGLFWYFHRDHHVRENKGFFEKNDFFFLIFAIPGAALSIGGWVQDSWSVTYYIGLGITLYGLAYFLIHDVFIHQRFRWLKKLDTPYFKAIRKAHHQHHTHINKEDGECFGMLWAPKKYFKRVEKMGG